MGKVLKVWLILVAILSHVVSMSGNVENWLFEEDDALPHTFPAPPYHEMVEILKGYILLGNFRMAKSLISDTFTHGKGYPLSEIACDTLIFSETIINMAVRHSRVSLDFIRHLWQFNLICPYYNTAHPTAVTRHPLIIAASLGRNDILRYLLEIRWYDLGTGFSHGFDVNVRDAEGMTPLLAACKEGHPDILQILFDQPSIDIFCIDGKGWNIFHHGSRTDNRQVYRTLINLAGFNIINQGDYRYRTPFMIACLHGSSSWVNNMIHNPLVQITSYDDKGANALHYAAKSGNPSLISIVMARYQSDVINMATIFENFSPIHWALYTGKSDSAVSFLFNDPNLNPVIKSNYRNQVRSYKFLMTSLRDKTLNNLLNMHFLSEKSSQIQEINNFVSVHRLRTINITKSLVSFSFLEAISELPMASCKDLKVEMEKVSFAKQIIPKFATLLKFKKVFDPNVRNSRGENVLTVAIKRQQPEIVASLLHHFPNSFRKTKSLIKLAQVNFPDRPDILQAMQSERKGKKRKEEERRG